MSLHLFDFKEAIAQNYRSALPAEFKISARATYDVLVMRVLTSNIDIHCKKNSKTIKLSNNFASFPYHIVRRKSTKQLKKLLHPFSLKDYVKFSKKYYGRNIIFYHNLLQELSFYFHYTNEKNYQAAFVNLYRILEYVSYSFPLIHSSHFGNYIGSFEAFRSYFTDVKTSEITFFEKFIENLFRGTAYLSYTTDFDFSHSDITVANNCYDALYKLTNSTNWITANRATQTLSIENKRLIRLFKDTRNRYFHFAVGGQRNIQNTDLKDPDFFFEKINSKYLNWIGFIYATVVRESLDNALL
ncbi:MAG: hypothetical protein JNM67_05005 [Bacteroidetes bacterium]|nr:hypothetical protein [Bacteroidota bacterium]